MRIDIGALLNGTVSVIPVDYTFVPDDSGALLLPEFTLTEPVHVTGRVSDMNGCLAVRVHVEAKYTVPCDRCLDPVSGTTAFDCEYFCAEDAADFENSDPEELLIIERAALDMDAMLTEQLSLELPLYHLCSEDCAGLCQKCGKNLNSGACNCEKSKEIDPRLKVFEKLLENPEEM